MTIQQKILEIAEENNGIITNKMVTELNLSRGILKSLSDNGLLEKIVRGVYILPNAWEDEFTNIQSRFSRGIYCHETALYLHGLTDRTPHAFHMAFPLGYNLTNVKKAGVKCSQKKLDTYSEGLDTVKSPMGMELKVYNVEKTLCDILVKRANVDIQITTEAFKKYSQMNNRNIPELSRYAKLLKVEDKVRSYLEVLL